MVFCFCVGMNVALHIHILTLKFGPWLFHNPTLVLYQCTIFLPSLWLFCIYLLAMISVLGRALFPNILPQNHQLPRWNLLADCRVSAVPGFFLRGGIHTFTGVLIGNHVLFVLIVGVHISPLLPVQICTHYELLLEVVFVNEFLWYDTTIGTLRGSSLMNGLDRDAFFIWVISWFTCWNFLGIPPWLSP